MRLWDWRRPGLRYARSSDHWALGRHDVQHLQTSVKARGSSVLSSCSPGSASGPFTVNLVALSALGQRQHATPLGLGSCKIHASCHSCRGLLAQHERRQEATGEAPWLPRLSVTPQAPQQAARPTTRRSREAFCDPLREASRGAKAGTVQASLSRARRCSSLCVAVGCLAPRRHTRNYVSGPSLDGATNYARGRAM